MRPFRYWRFFDEAEVTIDYNDLLDEKLWDGSGQVSRGFYPAPGRQSGFDDRHRRELLHTDRFEVTTLHAGGQDKGTFWWWMTWPSISCSRPIAPSRSWHW